MKALVTGADGMLGVDLCTELFRQGYVVLAMDIQIMDVRRSSSVLQTIQECAPDIVFHLAALTDVDACEQEPKEAFRTNTIGTQNVALACQVADIPMIYVSTISVFDGDKNEAYTEFDEPNPQNVYSRSKYEGEKIVQRLLHRYYIVRAGWMFGGGNKDKKFVGKILELATNQDELQIVGDKFGSPTYTLDFARATIHLSRTGWYGLYHLVNIGTPCSRFGFARHILKYAGITTCRPVAVESAHFPSLAFRPRMEAARNLHAELLDLDLMRPWQKALREYIQEKLCYSRLSPDVIADQ